MRQRMSGLFGCFRNVSYDTIHYALYCLLLTAVFCIWCNGILPRFTMIFFITLLTALMVFAVSPDWCVRSVRFKRSRARKVGLRRYKAVRRHRCRSSPISCFCRCLCNLIFSLMMLWAFQVAWTISSHTRNQRMHALNGNGGGSGGKGKGYNKGRGEQFKGTKGGSKSLTSPDTADVEREFRLSIQEALPEQARYRAQPSLLAEEWNAPIVPYQQLGSSGGISICPKHALPAVLRQVGHTARPCAVLLVESPDALGLKSYPRSIVSCSLSVAGNDCARERVTVQRFLVQLGFGPPVLRQVDGTEVRIDIHMRRMAAKFSVHRGWAPGEHPGNILVAHVQQWIPDIAIDQVQPRINGSFSFLCHSGQVDTLLQASGQDGVFYKQLDSDENFELVWLREGASLEEARRLATEDAASFGLAEKGKTGLLAVRFKTVDAASSFATRHSLFDSASVGRWKISGVPSSTGLHGLCELLHARKWTGIDIIYMDDRQAIFHSTTMGDASALFYTHDGQPHPIKFKAVNSVSQKMAKAARAAAESSATAKSSTQNMPSSQSLRQQQQQSFLQKVVSEAASRSIHNAPASPRRSSAEKRTATRTGETPDAKK